MVAPCSNTPANPILVKDDGLGLQRRLATFRCVLASDTAIPACHFGPNLPAPAILLRPSCTALAAVSRKAATAAVATGRCLSRISLSQADWSTLTLNFTASAVNSLNVFSIALLSPCAPMAAIDQIVSAFDAVESSLNSR